MSHGHGHGHGHGNVDLEAELAGAMPEPYCETSWKQMVTVLGVTSVAVFGGALWAHFSGSTQPPLPVPAVAQAQVASPEQQVAMTMGAWGQAVPAPVWGQAAQQNVPTAVWAAPNIQQHVQAQYAVPRAAVPPTPVPQVPVQQVVPQQVPVTNGWTAAPVQNVPGQWGPQPVFANQIAMAQPAQANSATSVDNNVQLVARTQRTAFNVAARAIRPSVVGIRASLAPGMNGTNIARIGSGVIVDPRGYVVTCNHVIAGATSVVVNRFREPNQQLATQVVAVQDDLALLRIVGDGPFPAAALVDSNGVEVGDWVLAVGHPFGLGLTVTAGIVGRKDGVLDIPGGQQYRGLFQTDAPINEGSSGGPLTNMNGEVVGLNTAIYAPTGVFSGAGFAIPSARIRGFLIQHLEGFNPTPTTPAPDPTGGIDVFATATGNGVPANMTDNAVATEPSAGPDLTPGMPKRGGGVVSPWGLRIAHLSPEQAQQLSFQSANGVVVTGVELNSPADFAQLAQGDVIVAIDNQAVSDVNSALNLQNRSINAGPIEIQIWRQGQTQRLLLNPTSST